MNNITENNTLGTWIPSWRYGQPIFKCSKCGECSLKNYAGETIKTKYCAFCGSTMENPEPCKRHYVHVKCDKKELVNCKSRFEAWRMGATNACEQNGIFPKEQTLDEMIEQMEE